MTHKHSSTTWHKLEKKLRKTNQNQRPSGIHGRQSWHARGHITHRNYIMHATPHAIHMFRKSWQTSACMLPKILQLLTSQIRTTFDPASQSQRDPSRQRPGPTAAKLDSDRTTGPTAANQKRKSGTDRQRQDIWANSDQSKSRRIIKAKRPVRTRTSPQELAHTQQKY